MIDFNNIEETIEPHFKGGNGVAKMRMFHDGKNRIMKGTLEKGCSIGMHTHETNSEIFYVVSGQAKVIIDGREEIVNEGQCHYCPKGSTHETINNTEEDLVLFCVVPEQ